jgi:hypothetical protein
MRLTMFRGFELGSLARSDFSIQTKKPTRIVYERTNLLALLNGGTTEDCLTPWCRAVIELSDRR